VYVYLTFFATEDKESDSILCHVQSVKDELKKKQCHSFESISVNNESDMSIKFYFFIRIRATV